MTEIQIREKALALALGYDLTTEQIVERAYRFEAFLQGQKRRSIQDMLNDPSIRA